MNGCEERRQVLSVTRRNTAPALEMEERVFDKVAQPIQIFVIVALHFAVVARRDHGYHALFRSLLDDGIAIISFFCQQVLGRHTLDQGLSLCAICSGSVCNNDSDRHTKRIHGQMYLGVEPPFVRPIP